MNWWKLARQQPKNNQDFFNTLVKPTVFSNESTQPVITSTSDTPSTSEEKTLETYKISQLQKDITSIIPKLYMLSWDDEEILKQYLPKYRFTKKHVETIISNFEGLINKLEKICRLLSYKNNLDTQVVNILSAKINHLKILQENFKNLLKDHPKENTIALKEYFSTTIDTVNTKTIPEYYQPSHFSGESFRNIGTYDFEGESFDDFDEFGQQSPVELIPTASIDDSSKSIMPTGSFENIEQHLNELQSILDSPSDLSSIDFIGRFVDEDTRIPFSETANKVTKKIKTIFGKIKRKLSKQKDTVERTEAEIRALISELDALDAYLKSTVQSIPSPTMSRLEHLVLNTLRQAGDTDIHLFRDDDETLEEASQLPQTKELKGLSLYLQKQRLQEKLDKIEQDYATLEHCEPTSKKQKLDARYALLLIAKDLFATNHEDKLITAHTLINDFREKYQYNLWFQLQYFTLISQYSKLVSSGEKEIKNSLAKYKQALIANLYNFFDAKQIGKELAFANLSCAIKSKTFISDAYFQNEGFFDQLLGNAECKGDDKKVLKLLAHLLRYRPSTINSILQNNPDLNKIVTHTSTISQTNEKATQSRKYFFPIKKKRYQKDNKLRVVLSLCLSDQPEQIQEDPAKFLTNHKAYRSLSNKERIELLRATKSSQIAEKILKTGPLPVRFKSSRLTGKQLLEMLKTMPENWEAAEVILGTAHEINIPFFGKRFYKKFSLEQRAELAAMNSDAITNQMIYNFGPMRPRIRKDILKLLKRLKKHPSDATSIELLKKYLSNTKVISHVFTDLERLKPKAKRKFHNLFANILENCNDMELKTSLIKNSDVLSFIVVDQQNNPKLNAVLLEHFETIIEKLAITNPLQHLLLASMHDETCADTTKNILSNKRLFDKLFLLEPSIIRCLLSTLMLHQIIDKKFIDNHEHLKKYFGSQSQIKILRSLDSDGTQSELSSPRNKTQETFPTRERSPSLPRMFIPNGQQDEETTKPKTRTSRASSIAVEPDELDLPPSIKRASTETLKEGIPEIERRLKYCKWPVTIQHRA